MSQAKIGKPDFYPMTQKIEEVFFPKHRLKPCPDPEPDPDTHHCYDKLSRILNHEQQRGLEPKNPPDCCSLLAARVQATL